MKRVLAMILLMVSISNLNVCADEIYTDDIKMISIAPNYVYINSFANRFDILSGGKTEYVSNLQSAETKDVRLYGYVQQFKNGNWVTIYSVSNLSLVGKANISGYYYVPKGYTYRYKVYGYAYSNGNLIESLTWISDTKVYQ